MLRNVLVALSLFGILLPVPLVHAVETAPDGAAQAAVAVDVALHDGGYLFGQAVDARGIPLAGQEASIRHQGREVVAATTDGTGYFLVKGLRGGMHEIAVGEARGLFRLWAPGTAPPLAEQGALLVAGGLPVRGQNGPIGFWLSKPWFVAGVVGASVAVPVAIHNHRVQRFTSP